jgi:hypothetical protein
MRKIKMILPIPLDLNKKLRDEAQALRDADQPTSKVDIIINILRKHYDTR